MAVATLYRQREEAKDLVETSGLDDERKERLRGLIPRMLPSELARLKLSLLRMFEIEASRETVDKIIETKEEPETEDAFWTRVLEKFMEKVDRVEEKMK